MNLQVPNKTDSEIPSNVLHVLPGRASSERELPSGEMVGPGISLTFLQYLAAVRRHAWRIAIFVAAAVLCTGIFLMRLHKQYQSTAVIRIDPSLPMDVVGNQGANSGGANMGAQLATDEKEIGSPAVVTPAILKAGLWKPPADGSSDSVPSSLVAKVAGGVKVNQVRGTYLLNVSYRSESPDLAAAMANTLAQQFIEHEYQTRNSALLSLTQYMRQQIKQLGHRMRSSQLALNAFERNNNIVNPDNMSGLLTQQLSSLQQDLGQEQARQRVLDANLALAKEGNIDALLVSDRGSALAPLLTAQQQAQIEFDALSAKYGPGNYLYQQEKRKLAHIKGAVRKEQQHVVAQIEAQAKAESVQVKLTARQLAETKAQLNQFNRKGVQFEILKHEADSDKSIYDSLLERVDAADVSAGYHSTAMRIVDAASPNPVPVYPRVKLTLLLAFLLSGALGVAGAVAVSGMDRTLRDPNAVSSTLGISLLGSLPQVQEEAELKSLMMPPAPHEDSMRNAFVESVLGIRSTLLLSASDGPVHSVAVVSSQPAEGKTVVSTNVALALAGLGKRTVLVDGDLRRPQVHRVLGLSNRRGLSSVLQGQSSLNDVLLPGPTEGLTVLPAGPTSAHAREMIAGRIGVLVEELKAQFDVVVLDTPPVLGFADGLNIATASDTTLVVVRAGNTPRECVQMLIKQLRQVRAHLGGIVLNGVTSEMGHHYYYYHDRYRSRYSGNNGNHGGQDV